MVGTMPAKASAAARARTLGARRRQTRPVVGRTRYIRGRRGVGVIVKGAECCAPPQQQPPQQPPQEEMDGGNLGPILSGGEGDEDDDIATDFGASYDAPPRVRVLLEGEGWTEAELRAQEVYEKGLAEEKEKRSARERDRASKTSRPSAESNGTTASSPKKTTIHVGRGGGGKGVPSRTKQRRGPLGTTTKAGLKKGSATTRGRQQQQQRFTPPADIQPDGSGDMDAYSNEADLRKMTAGTSAREGDDEVDDDETSSEIARLRNELVEEKLLRLQLQQQKRAPYDWIDWVRMRLFSFRNEEDTDALREILSSSVRGDGDEIAEYTSLGAVPSPSVASRFRHVRIDNASFPVLALLFGGVLGACVSMFARRRREKRMRLKAKSLDDADRTRRRRVRREMYVKKVKMHRMREDMESTEGTGPAEGDALYQPSISNEGVVSALDGGETLPRSGVASAGVDAAPRLLERRGSEDDLEDAEMRDWMYLSPREASLRSRRRNLERLRADPFKIHAKEGRRREVTSGAARQIDQDIGVGPERPGGDATVLDDAEVRPTPRHRGDELPLPAFDSGDSFSLNSVHGKGDLGSFGVEGDVDSVNAASTVDAYSTERSASSPELSVSLMPSSLSPASVSHIEKEKSTEESEGNHEHADEAAVKIAFGPQSAPRRPSKTDSDAYRRQMAIMLDRQRALRDEAAKALQERGLVPVQVPEELTAWWRGMKVIYVVGSRDDGHQMQGAGPRLASQPMQRSSQTSPAMSLFQVNLSPDPMISCIPHCLGFASRADAVNFVDFLCALPPEDRELAFPSASSRPFILPRPPGDIEELCLEQDMGATVLPEGALKMRPGRCLGDLLNALGHNDGVQAVVSEYMDRQLLIMQTLDSDGVGDAMMASPGM